MKLVEIHAIAKRMGMKKFVRMRKADLIRRIQIEEGNADCFKRIPNCGQNDCLWREDCIKSTAT